jgi:D-3-phosphoglycerate dehydrogenase
VFDSLMRITVTTELGKRSFAGAVIGGAPRVVEVKGMELDAPFSPAMLYVNNLDKPGFIGALGALLGDAGVNIATFNLGRVAAGEDAIALVGVDQAPDAALLGKIKALPHVKEARALKF